MNERGRDGANSEWVFLNSVVGAVQCQRAATGAAKLENGANKANRQPKVRPYATMVLAQFQPTCGRKQTQSRGPHQVTLVPLRRRRASYVPFDHPCPADDSWGNAPLAFSNSSPHFIGAEPRSGAQSGRSPGFELSLRVHGKYRHGDSPSGGQAKEQKTPGLEVLFPAILAGIEEPADSTILWVDAGQVRSLVKIAVMAG